MQLSTDGDNMQHAVEVNVSQARRLGATANLYIVEGFRQVFVHSAKGDLAAIQCDITTREGARKNRIGWLAPNALGITVDDDGGLRPRPNHQHQWEEREGRWFRRLNPIVIQ